ncbi:MAG: hypothetical protein ABW032_12025 [Burkholderiaceae bacterium]
MHEAIHNARARVVSAMEYLTSIRLSTHESRSSTDVAAIQRAETLLRGALGDLSEATNGSVERRRSPRLLMESVTLGEPDNAAELDSAFTIFIPDDDEDIDSRLDGADGALSSQARRGETALTE